jgi:predicted DNA-binding transcriptional regulator AlpA
MSSHNGRLLLRPRDLVELLGVSISTIRRLEREGILPPKIRMSRRVSGWRRDDLENWLRCQKGERP